RLLAEVEEVPANPAVLQPDGGERPLLMRVGEPGAERALVGRTGDAVGALDEPLEPREVADDLDAKLVAEGVCEPPGVPADPPARVRAPCRDELVERFRELERAPSPRGDERLSLERASERDERVEERRADRRRGQLDRIGGAVPQGRADRLEQCVE